MAEEIKGNENTITPSDLHAIATATQLTKRESEVIFGEAGNVTYNEYSDLAKKLIELDDFESVIRLRNRYDALVEEYADKIVHDKRDYTPEEPVLTTREDMDAVRKHSASAFPEAYARVQAMINMGKRHIAEVQHDKIKEKRKNKVALSIGLLEQIKEIIAPEDALQETPLDTYSEWLRCIDDIRTIIEGDDFEASDTAIKKINDLYLFSRLNDKRWLANEVASLRRSLQK